MKMTIENYHQEIKEKLIDLKFSFNDYGWYADLLEGSNWGFTASPNKEQDFNYCFEDSDSGLFMIVIPVIDHEDQSMKCRIHISNLVITGTDRGKGIAKNIIAEIISTFHSDNIDCIEFTDYSGGFWSHIEKSFPEVNFKKEENE